MPHCGVGSGGHHPSADLARSQMEYIQLNNFSSEQDGYQVESQMIVFQPNQINQISHCFEFAGKELSWIWLNPNWQSAREVHELSWFWFSFWLLLGARPDHPHTQTESRFGGDLEVVERWGSWRWRWWMWLVRLGWSGAFLRWSEASLPPPQFCLTQPWSRCSSEILRRHGEYLQFT